jgi:S1-C subfamily serine protease
MRKRLRTLSPVAVAVLGVVIVFASPAAANPDTIENAVVKVFATSVRPDPFKPWTKQSPREVTGSGVIIEGNRILTNAHVVVYATQVQVQANQSGERISASVVAIATGIDLAVLRLEDETLFANRPPVARTSALPDVKEPVLAYGYPTGGSSLSITKGIISRIEFVDYHRPVSGLRIQIDAAINPGNSGGPAVSADKMIGLAFSQLGGAQNISYIIPNEEIELFLADVADGTYDGKPAIYDEFQKLENAALRSFLNLDRSIAGVVVKEPYETDPGYPLKRWDVVTRIGDARIDEEGMVRVGDHLRVRFQYLVQRLAKQGTIPLTLVRAGKEMTVEVPVHRTRPMLIDDLRGAHPSYFVFGPLAFSTVTTQFVDGIAGNAQWLNQLSIRGSPIVTRRGDRPDAHRENLVVVSSPFFPHRLAKGYRNPFALVIDTLNGRPVKSLNHLVELLRDSKDELIRLEFFGHDTEALVLPRKACLEATEQILIDNGVRARGSADTLAVWNAKPGS